jgi:hypothetical protein
LLEECGRCGECEVCISVACDCKNCSDCGFLGGQYGFGRVLGDKSGDEPGIADAVEILKYVVKLDSVISDSNASRAAAMITGGETPGIGDAVEILKFVVKLDSELDEHYDR